jgi:hypothetical protein
VIKKPQRRRPRLNVGCSAIGRKKLYIQILELDYIDVVRVV